MTSTWEVWGRWVAFNGNLIEKQVAICATREIAIAEVTRLVSADDDPSIPPQERGAFRVQQGSILMGFRLVE